MHFCTCMHSILGLILLKLGKKKSLYYLRILVIPNEISGQRECRVTLYLVKQY